MGFKLLIWTDDGSGDSPEMQLSVTMPERRVDQLQLTGGPQFLMTRPRAALMYAYVEKCGRRDGINYNGLLTNNDILVLYIKFATLYPVELSHYVCKMLLLQLLR
jgi:hypothetical protein